jgi:hypothetical protein
MRSIAAVVCCHEMNQVPVSTLRGQRIKVLERFGDIAPRQFCVPGGFIQPRIIRNPPQLVEFSDCCVKLAFVREHIDSLEATEWV